MYKCSPAAMHPRRNIHNHVILDTTPLLSVDPLRCRLFLLCHIQLPSIRPLVSLPWAIQYWMVALLAGQPHVGMEPTGCL
jgi:hypothetical protein